MSKQHKPAIQLYAGLKVNSPETLAEVLRLLDSLDDLKPSSRMSSILRARMNEALYKPKKQEQRPGRRMIG